MLESSYFCGQGGGGGRDTEQPLCLGSLPVHNPVLLEGPGVAGGQARNPHPDTGTDFYCSLAGLSLQEGHGGLLCDLKTQPETRLQVPVLRLSSNVTPLMLLNISGPGPQI